MCVSPALRRFKEGIDSDEESIHYGSKRLSCCPNCHGRFVFVFVPGADLLTMKLFLPYEKILIFIPVLLLMASCSKSHPVNPNAVVLEKEKRFISYSDGTVIDTKHRLMWPSVDFRRYMSWTEAETFCKSYTGGGYSDWRLPSLKELQTLFDPDRVSHSGYHTTRLIKISGNVWASDISVLVKNRPDKAGFEDTQHAGYMDFKTGKTAFIFAHQKIPGFRILPVRSAK
jgi:hypothetical protein